MQTNRTFIESFMKASVDSPWVISIASPSTKHLTRVSVGAGGEVEVGPRLSEVLSNMGRLIDAYPFQFTYHKLERSDINDYLVRMLSNYIVYVEAGIDSYRALNTKNCIQHGKISFTNTFRELLPNDTYTPNQMTASYVDQQPDSGQYQIDGFHDTSWLILPEQDKYGLYNIKIKDGDTLAFTIGKMGSEASKHTDDKFAVGKEVTIRYVGLNCPETKAHFDANPQEGNQKNAEYCDTYKVSLDQAYEIGQEAMDYVTKAIGYNLIAVDLDTDTMGMPSKDIYGRYIGVIYVLQGVNYNDVLSKGAYGINLNKTLLATPSTKYSPAPLAEPYEHFIDDVGYVRFDVVEWLYQLGIRTPNTDTGQSISSQTNLDLNAGASIPSVPGQTNTNDTDTLVMRYQESPDNRLQFVKPLDDRQDELFGDGLVDDRVRIGDVCLVIPPLSIQSNRVSTINREKVLRSKASIMTKTTGSNQTITLQLYFHDLDSINGKQIDNGLGMTYWMDGLRPLIAQFKKTPFLPIDNEYINNTLNIHDVALVNLNVTTVPGFPQSIAATLTLAKFDMQAYMPGTPSLGDAINYPLLRWYYQEAMREHLLPDGTENTYRTYLKSLNGPLTNTFKFSLADEAQLLERQDAIQHLRSLDTPQMIQAKIDDATTELGKQIKDGENAQTLLKSIKKYQSIKSDMNIGNTVVDKNASVYDQYQQGLKDYNASKATDSKDANGETWFTEYDSDAYNHFMGSMTKEWRDKYEKQCKQNGILFVTVRSLANLKLYTDIEINGYDKNAQANIQNSKGVQMIIPAYDTERLQRMIDRGYQAVSSANDQIELYNKTQALVQQSEGALTLNEFPINGLTPISLSVVYENTFVPVQMEQNDSPTLQYLGAQDPYIQVAFNATQEAVEGIRRLLDEAERYSSQYRLGITSGFVGVQNDLLSVFGVDTVLPETVTFSTIEGMPGHSEIQMNLWAFTKTQKRMETLEGISPIYGDVDKDSRHSSQYDSSKDNAVIENRMKQMEVYPDLELPEHDELSAALPKIGAQMDYYENRTNARFLDPDFYVSTEWTFREYIRQLRQKEQRLDFVDFAGLAMYTSTSESDPITPVNADTLKTAYQLDDDTPDVAGSFSNGNDTMQGGVFVSSNSDATTSGMAAINLPSAADVKAIKDWLNSPANINTIPSITDFANWNGVDTSMAHSNYAAWLNHLQPTEQEVYMEIYNQIDSYFMGSKGWIYDDKKDTSDAWKKATYGAVEDIYFANYRVMAAKDPKMPKKSNDPETIKTTDYKKFAMITRERLANYIKALFDVQSGWKQMRADNKPKTNFNTDAGIYRAGIGGIDVAAFAKNTSEAKRLLWDWRFNLQKAMYCLYGIYLEAASESSAEYKSHPWDWMVYGFGEGKFDLTKKSNYQQTVLSKFKNVYNHDTAIYATPTYSVNPAIMQVRDTLTDYQYKVITGEKDALLSELKKAGMSQSKIDELSKKSPSEVRSAYEQYMKDTYDPSSSDTTVAPVGQAMEAYQAGQQAAAEGRKNASDADKEVYENFKYYEKIHGVADDEANKLVNDVDPYTLFQEMFTDMVDYDMRGRLARAFPAFQLFIIDEGRWMGNYRLWDNLYGYNAIQSIDVHRSRKIAADTCIINMTNVYSNLTSRPMGDNSPDTNNYDFWDQLVFQNPSEKLLEARQQLLQSMLLEAGARIHLRIGYGSDVEFLPTVFNGTITEIETGEMIQIVAQGDGLELTNVISADPNDENNHWWGKTKEPRDFLCQLMTSKGNWVKNAVNWASDGRFFKDNPLGIQHFGNPMDAVWTNVSWNPQNMSYGEVAQNIYSANGMETFSDYVWDRTGASSEKDMEKEKRLPFKWKGFIPDWSGGDEPDIKIKLYGQTVWDVANIFAACVPDYITAVHPFETRSTLFYGKPYWRLAYRYSSQYQYNSDTKEWDRTILEQHRKPYMQFHFADSHMDIVSNNIQASADFSNVIIAEYDGGHLTQPIYADYDIYFAQQRTKQVKVNIVSSPALWNFWTGEKQAMYAGMSILRDECKDMYQGSLVMLGSPTLKPYDMVYMNDTMHEMNGNFLVKSVTHHFSFDTGFVTSVEPDALVVTDDKAIMSMSNWGASFGISAASAVLGLGTAMVAKKKVLNSSLARKAVELGKKGSTKAIEQALRAHLKGLPDDDPDIKLFKDTFKEYLDAKTPEEKNAARALLQNNQAKLEGKLAQWEAEGKFLAGEGKNVTGIASKMYYKGLLSGTKNMVTALTDGAEAFKILRAAQIMTSFVPLSIIADLAIQWGIETLLEQWRRKKACYQAVLMMPLKYQGREYTAGINGHMGMVYGDTKQGKMDNFLSGLGFKDGDIFDNLFQWYGETMNALSGDNKQYIYNNTKPDSLAGIQD